MKSWDSRKESRDLKIIKPASGEEPSSKEECYVYMANVSEIKKNALE